MSRAYMNCSISSSTEISGFAGKTRRYEALEYWKPTLENHLNQRNMQLQQQIRKPFPGLSAVVDSTLVLRFHDINIIIFVLSRAALSQGVPRLAAARRRHNRSEFNPTELLVVQHGDCLMV